MTMRLTAMQRACCQSVAAAAVKCVRAQPAAQAQMEAACSCRGGVEQVVQMHVLAQQLGQRMGLQLWRWCQRRTKGRWEARSRRLTVHAAAQLSLYRRSLPPQPMPQLPLTSRQAVGSGRTWQKAARMAALLEARTSRFTSLRSRQRCQRRQCRQAACHPGHLCLLLLPPLMERLPRLLSPLLLHRQGQVILHSTFGTRRHSCLTIRLRGAMAAVMRKPVARQPQLLLALPLPAQPASQRHRQLAMPPASVLPAITTTGAVPAAQPVALTRGGPQRQASGEHCRTRSLQPAMSCPVATARQMAIPTVAGLITVRTQQWMLPACWKPAGILFKLRAVGQLAGTCLVSHLLLLPVELQHQALLHRTLEQRKRRPRHLTACSQT